MKERFLRCPHCGGPHAIGESVCPNTGRLLPGAELSAMPTQTIADPLRRRALRAQHSQEALPAPQLIDLPPVGPGNFAPTREIRATSSLIGKRIGGRYLVKRILGEGGMGTVYEGVHEGLARRVAIKVLSPMQAQKRVAVKRFQQEARAAGSIGHRNICEVYDQGTLDDGSPYIVMEKLVGRTLADRIGEKGALPPDEVVDVLMQVLSGLTAAHEKHIVHRDIKPENIYLVARPDGAQAVKILDFGVSKVIAQSGEQRESDLDLTRAGMVMGTPYYMSPEQARGERDLDARVDVFACGVVMYEALTGRRPYDAPNYNALLVQIISTCPIPARHLRPDLPFGYDGVLDRAMAHVRDERYPSASAFQRALLALRTGARVPPPPTREERERAEHLGGPASSRGPDSARPPQSYPPPSSHVPPSHVPSSRAPQSYPPPPSSHAPPSYSQPPQSSRAPQSYAPPPMYAAPPPSTRAPLYVPDVDLTTPKTDEMEQQDGTLLMSNPFHEREQEVEEPPARFVWDDHTKILKPHEREDERSRAMQETAKKPPDPRRPDPRRGRR